VLSVNFTFHLHQPVGNFGFVVERAYEDAYRPFVEALLAHPTFRCNLHVSGCLCEHLEGAHPEFIDSLRQLAARGQVEMLASGFYEPILTEIPHRDALAQVELMREFIRERFDQVARGFWCTERIYDTELPLLAKQAGLEYTLLDDYLFLRVLEEEVLSGCLAVRERGCDLKVFPISEQMRYLIPFKPVSELAAYLEQAERNFAARGVSGALVVFGDDAEKFGVWPGTKQWVYESGWLEDFFALFEQNRERYRLVLLGEHCQDFPPREVVRLQPGSYREMCEWVLPPERQRKLAQAKRILTRHGVESPERLLAGGEYRLFYRKYEEARRMHFKNRYISALVAAAAGRAGSEEAPLAAKAREHLLRSQCNCAYWHGVFGGLYLNYLREAVEVEMLRAENAACAILKPELPKVEVMDFYEDGEEAIQVRSRSFSFLVSPARGLAIDYLDYHCAELPLLAGMGRYREYYHDQLLQQEDVAGPHASIHERVRLKDGQYLPRFSFDVAPRLNFVDMLYPDFMDTRLLAEGSAEPVTALWTQAYQTNLDRLQVSGELPLPGGTITKTIRWHNEGELQVEYLVQAAGDERPGVLVTELNLNLLTDAAADRFAEYAGARLPLAEVWEVVEPRSELAFIDGYRRVRIALIPRNLSRLGFYPVRTLTMSEGGAELLYQAQAVVAFGSLQDANEVRFGLTLNVKPL